MNTIGQQRRLDGQVALVTGAGQGVGRGIALALAGAGAAVALVSRTAAKLDVVAREIEARGSRALVLPCDVKDAAGLAAAVERTVGALRGLQILVNAAQQVPLGRLEQVTDEAFEAGWQSGPLASFRLMKLARPHLAKRGGVIINLASSAALRWDASGYGAYGAVKEAIRQLTRAAACEWAAEGIRVNTILPLANSPGMQGWTTARPDEAAAFTATVPQGRVGDCEHDIGAFVVTLCSDDSRYVTGQSICVDGGQARLG
ncbi:MAG TPA: SDR family oxidoreductase [Nevskiaceae bacterium]|nr:SDR family oxidoreductase [Nevskiaceae bacterium]